ncbi:OmpA family protein [Arenibacter certesii]|uniref:Cell envelope biogenesis protein OmpA n=1 Tax=Arenibacter certesii TaxID=228955 RepID=A0A918MJQ4_9FLAO|nr:OmpA family protein [Arenibacter certesii]GGW29500.1 cell envelope biogenesis protein OmpA [Arenibacter certesii]
MRFSNLYLLLLFIPSLCFAQQKRSKGDIAFFEYSYRTAIEEYQKEQIKGALTNQQYLNLADSYLRMSNYKNAAKIYVDIFKKDTIMSPSHFNRLLQSIAKTSGMEEVKTFLSDNNSVFSGELLENAEFNYELLQSKSKPAPNYGLFNVSANSSQGDFSPAFFYDKVLFSSGRPRGSKKVYNPSGEAFFNIYEAEVDSKGDLNAVKEFEGLMDSPFHKSTPYYAAELDRIFYSLSNADGEQLLFSDKGKNAMSIGMSSGVDSHTYILRDLDTSFHYPFYEGATGRLFFAANFDDSYGGTDLYYVHTNNGIIMSSPVNLGPRINTPGNEIAPFIFDNTLYFASDVFYGLGGMDIYRSNLQENDNFSIPVNLGSAINSAEDDFGMIIKLDESKGFVGYFASNRSGGKGNDDIYGFHMDEKPGLKTLALKGAIKKPNDGVGIDGAVISLLDNEGTIIKEVIADRDGNYELEIPWRDNVILKAIKERYSTYKQQFDAASLDTVDTAKFNLEMVSIDDIVTEHEEQNVIKLNKFFFNKGKYNVTPEISRELDKVVAAINSFPELQLKIESHTDSRGSNRYNINLSNRRSDAIKDYLMQEGVPENNIIESVGYGEEQLLNNCKNGVFCLEMLHNRNERTNIIILNYNELFGLK